ncbi:MAG: hypothetical protein IPH94_11830 [Saprospiraceae bacterium]|nr:hypothetical protein [Saprospiraceae bacterium]
MKLFRPFALILMVLPILFLGCDDDDPIAGSGDLKLKFKLRYGDQTLVMFEPYTYPTGQKMTFSRFSFFLADVKLKNASGSTSIHDISYHNLTNSHTGASSAANGYDYTIGGVKPGAYTSIQFTLGVPKASNDKTPDDFSNDHVLSNQAEYWSGWKSYVFTTTEGLIDLDGDGTLAEGYALHTGANESLRTVELPASIVIEEGKEAGLTILVDIKKEFGSNPIYDIETNPQIHSLSQMPFVKQLIDNLATAFSVE